MATKYVVHDPHGIWHTPNKMFEVTVKVATPVYAKRGHSWAAVYRLGTNGEEICLAVGREFYAVGRKAAIMAIHAMGLVQGPSPATKPLPALTLVPSGSRPSRAPTGLPGPSGQQLNLWVTSASPHGAKIGPNSALFTGSVRS